MLTEHATSDYASVVFVGFAAMSAIWYMISKVHHPTLIDIVDKHGCGI